VWPKTFFHFGGYPFSSRSKGKLCFNPFPQLTKKGLSLAPMTKREGWTEQLFSTLVHNVFFLASTWLLKHTSKNSVFLRIESLLAELDTASPKPFFDSPTSFYPPFL
jgi:hypothetical protein